MQEILPQDAVPGHLKGCSVAIGNFDGMHRGHQALLNVARAEAERRGLPWGILTFEPHPASYFRPNEPVFRLSPHPLKSRLAKASGVDLLAVVGFNAEIAASTPEEFVLHHLVNRLGVSHVVTGYDFHFGKGRKGTPETLAQLGKAHGFGVSTVDQVTSDSDGKAPFSSSSIRSAIRRGHVRNAADELGYRWIVMGEVVHGDKRGRSIGFPTANIIVDPGAEPARGIYAVEVRDAFAAYEAMAGWSPAVGKDLLAAHALLMRGLVDDAGRYRRGGVGIAQGTRVVHLAPPAARVPGLMKDLLGWLKRTDVHPLIAGCVFHYELEFIHPFADGNGRMGRLWQTLILSCWKPLLAWLPVESVIRERQAEYHEALAASDKAGHSTPFIEFLLSALLSALEQVLGTDPVTAPVSDPVKALLKVLGRHTLSAAACMEKRGLSHRATFRQNYL